MKKQLAVWQLIQSSLVNYTPVMLLYVLQSAGSSPGRQGFFMAVNKNGGMMGSIGGGIMEHKFVEMAREALNTSSISRSSFIKKQVHDKLAKKDQSGMICSGEQINYFYLVQQKDLPAIEKIMHCIREQQHGILSLSPAGLSFSEGQGNAEQATQFHLSSEEDWMYEEQLGFRNKLFIIGGGHCALALSRLMSTMSFYIYLYDTREGLHTINENHFAHEKHILKDYRELNEHIPPGKNHFVVVMTVGYRTDMIAVSALAVKQFGYFGLLGSKTKVSKLMDELEKNGISKDALARMHAPIGIPINSQTPEEIAISIAAEIIREKNRF
jgi:xanthine dehydrogenase accessory factor